MERKIRYTKLELLAKTNLLWQLISCAISIYHFIHTQKKTKPTDRKKKFKSNNARLTPKAYCFVTRIPGVGLQQVTLTISARYGESPQSTNQRTHEASLQ